jgi:hypothetical protein
MAILTHVCLVFSSLPSRKAILKIYEITFLNQQFWGVNCDVQAKREPNTIEIGQELGHRHYHSISPSFCNMNLDKVFYFLTIPIFCP